MDYGYRKLPRIPALVWTKVRHANLFIWTAPCDKRDLGASEPETFQAYLCNVSGSCRGVFAGNTTIHSRFVSAGVSIKWPSPKFRCGSYARRSKPCLHYSPAFIATILWCRAAAPAWWGGIATRQANAKQMHFNLHHSVSLSFTKATTLSVQRLFGERLKYSNGFRRTLKTKILQLFVCFFIR